MKLSSHVYVSEISVLVSLGIKNDKKKAHSLMSTLFPEKGQLVAAAGAKKYAKSLNGLHLD